MATVTLQDGRKINFAGTPTQADIDEVVSGLSAVQPTPTKSLSLLRPVQLAESVVGAAKEEFGGAVSDIQEAKARQERGEQGALRTGITTVAQGAQAGLSTAFRGVLSLGSALLPDFIENPLRRELGEKFEDFIQSESGQKLVSGIQDISQKIDALDPKNKQLVRDVGDTLMTAVDLTAFGVGGKAARKGLEAAGEAAGKTGTELVERSAREQIQSVRGRIADMIIDDTTPTRRTALATRTQEGGFFSGRTVTPTAVENRVVDELLTTPDIKVNRSALFNLNATVRAIEKEANDLVVKLKKDNFIFPKQEASARLNSTLDNLKKTDTDIIGDAEKLADRIFDKMKVFVADSDGTGLGALRARQNFDKWVTTKKPKAFEKQDAFNTAVRSARNTMNDFLVEKATKTDVKSSLQRQSMLIRAKDVLAVKSGSEAGTGFGRLLDKAMAVLGRKNQIVQLIAAVVGIGGLGAAATFAPAAAVAGGFVGLGLGLVRLATSPAGRKKLGQLLLAIEKVLPKAKGEERAILQELHDEIKALTDDINPSLGLSIKDVSGGKPSVAPTKQAPITPKVENTLATEARKYKSAEKVYRGGSENSTGKILGGEFYAPKGEPLWFSKTQTGAERYGSSVIKADLSKLNLLDTSEIAGSKEVSAIAKRAGLTDKYSIKDPRFVKQLIKEGYDGLVMGNGNDFAVFNKEAINKINAEKL